MRCIKKDAYLYVNLDIVSVDTAIVSFTSMIASLRSLNAYIREGTEGSYFQRFTSGDPSFSSSSFLFFFKRN